MVPTLATDTANGVRAFVALKTVYHKSTYKWQCRDTLKFHSNSLCVIYSHIRQRGCSPNVPSTPKLSYGITTMVQSFISSQYFVVGSGHSWDMTQNDGLHPSESKLGNKSKRTLFRYLLPSNITSNNIHRSHLHCFILSKHQKQARNDVLVSRRVKKCEIKLAVSPHLWTNQSLPHAPPMIKLYSHHTTVKHDFC